MAKFFFTNKAIDDLTSIWQYTVSIWSEKQADFYYSQIINTCNLIASETNHLDREYSEICQGLYARPCKKHLIFYREMSDTSIMIVRILHERMDIDSKFPCGD